MRAVVQRVSRARVTADGSVTGEIAMGLLILLGVGRDDTSAVSTSMAEKISNLRRGGKNESLVAGRKRQRLGCLTVHTVRRRARAAQTELRCCRTARTSKERLRRICGSAAQVGSHRGDRSFRRNDVRGTSQRRSCDHSPGLRQNVLDSGATKTAERFGAFLERIVRLESGFALLGDFGFFALRFQFSELLRRENSLGVTEKCLAAFLRAACLHAFGLPGFNLCLLIRCEIQRGQINAVH